MYACRAHIHFRLSLRQFIASRCLSLILIEQCELALEL
jgi:hypothetical protein